MNGNVEEKIQELHKQIIDLFPDAVGVEIFVNSYEISVEPSYKTDLKNVSMQTLSGKWVNKVADI